MSAITHLRQWGNSLAIRIPNAFADETGLHPDDELIITVQGGQLVLTPVRAKMVTLDELMEGFTDENKPGEWDMGGAVGHEIW